MSTVIASVDHRSPAQRAGIRPGEKLLTINGHDLDAIESAITAFHAENEKPTCWTTASTAMMPSAGWSCWSPTVPCGMYRSKKKRAWILG